MSRAWLELARVSNLPTVWTNVVAGWVLCGGGWMEWQLFWLVLGGSLLYTAGMILNDAADVAFDREHRPERAIPSGRISLRTAWVVGLVMMGAGAVAVLAPGDAEWPWVLALVVAILVYDLYHKPWPGSVWVMGACRTLLVLAAGSGADRHIVWSEDRMLVVHAIVLGLYIVGLSLVARAEGAGRFASWTAESGKLLLVMPSLVWVGMIISDSTVRKLVGVVSIAIVIMQLLVVWYALRLMRQGGPQIGRAVGILLAAIPIVDALAVCVVSWPLALGFVVLSPLLRLWQRKIAAT